MGQQALDLQYKSKMPVKKTEPKGKRNNSGREKELKKYSEIMTSILRGFWEDEAIFMRGEHEVSHPS